MIRAPHDVVLALDPLRGGIDGASTRGYHGVAGATLVRRVVPAVPGAQRAGR